MATCISIRRLEPFGAEVDLDLSASLSPHQADELRALLGEHHLLTFRKQDLSPEKQREFMSIFGPVITGQYDIHVVSNDEKKGLLGKAELVFHSDLSYTPEPQVAISLHAIEIDSGNTSTRFLDNVRAYARLPETMKQTLSTLQIRHVMPLNNMGGNTYEPGTPAHVHPAVMKHPTTGQKFLYISLLNVADVIGMPDGSDGRDLINVLATDSARDNVYEHVWYLGDVVVWDNLACVHARGAISDTPRTLQRAAVGKGVLQLEVYGDTLQGRHFNDKLKAS